MQALLLLIFLVIHQFARYAHSLIDRLPPLQISDTEIRNFVNGLREQNVPLDLPIEFQGHTATRDSADRASQRLFQQVEPLDVFRSSTSVRNLFKLYDNYNPLTGEPEEDTREEREEEAIFIETVLRSQPMEQLRQLLLQKGHPYGQNSSIFKAFFQQIWFDHYSRAQGQSDSSGFEHVFIGEFKNGEVSGLHNWIRILFLEQNPRAHFDYKGFLIKRSNIFGAVRYSWEGRMKPGGSFLIGTTPEFDMALFTLCFLARRGGTGSCNFELDGCPMMVTSFELVQQGRVYVGSIFPSAGKMTSECRLKGGRSRTGT